MLHYHMLSRSLTSLMLLLIAFSTAISQEMIQHIILWLLANELQKDRGWCGGGAKDRSASLYAYQSEFPALWK